MATPTRPGRAGRDANAQEIAPGLPARKNVRWNLQPPALYEEAVRRGEGQAVAGGAFNAITTL